MSRIFQLSESIEFLKLRDQCLSPKVLSRFVELTFTSVEYFSASMKESFVATEDESVTFPVLLFHACVFWVHEEMDGSTFLQLLRRIRQVVYFTTDSKVFTKGEEDFAFDFAEACFDPMSLTSLKDVKKQIILMINRYPENAALGRQMLGNEPFFSDETIAFFASRYLGSEQMFRTSERAVSHFFGVLASLGPSVDLNRLRSRIRKVELLKELVLRQLVKKEGRIVLGRTVFDHSLQNFSSACQRLPVRVGMIQSFNKRRTIPEVQSPSVIPEDIADSHESSELHQIPFCIPENDKHLEDSDRCSSKSDEEEEAASILDDEATLISNSLKKLDGLISRLEVCKIGDLTQIRQRLDHVKQSINK